MDDSNDFPRRTGRAMIFVASLMVLGLLTWFFQGALDSQYNPNQNLHSEMVGGARQVTLKANRQDHYVAAAQINRQPVEVMIDTGATQVAIAEATARRIGLVPGAPTMVSTANGMAQVRLTRLDSVRIGDIEVRDVGGIIVPNMSDPEVLIGMNFLRELEMTHREGQLILRQP